MANRIQPHPNPPYLKGDGTLNVSGQIKLYEAGTSTPKVAYKDAAGTSYGSTIDLNSSGLPTDGPIYWDTTTLYKVDVYTRVDDTPTYTLDYTVDHFGTGAGGNISTPTVWVVDGVGATDITFASLSAALDQARLNTIGVGGYLTINVNAGTFIESSLDWRHDDGKRIAVVGSGRLSTFIVREAGVSMSLVLLNAGYVIDKIAGMTFDSTNTPTTAHAVIDLDEGASIYTLSDILIKATTFPLTVGIYLRHGNSVYGGNDIYMEECDIGVWCDNASYLSIKTYDYKALNGGGRAMQIQGGSNVLIDGSNVVGASGSTVGGYAVSYNSILQINDDAFDYVSTALLARYNALIIQSGTQSFTNTASQYNPPLELLKDITGSGSDDAALIHDAAGFTPS